MKRLILVFLFVMMSTAVMADESKYAAFASFGEESLLAGVRWNYLGLQVGDRMDTDTDTVEAMGFLPVQIHGKTVRFYGALGVASADVRACSYHGKHCSTSTDTDWTGGAGVQVSWGRMLVGAGWDDTHDVIGTIGYSWP